MEIGTLAVPRRLLLSPTQVVYLTQSPEASTAHGIVNLGNGLFDDLSSGSFTGSSGGTVLAINAAPSFTGNLIDLQAAGTSVCAVSAAGALTSADTISGTALAAAGLPGATAASRYAGATASGAPLSGAFNTGDYVIDQSGAVWVCTAGGSPGTWTVPGGVQKISESTSGSAFASVTFSSIPGSYRHLFLDVVGRGDAAATTTNVQLQFNSDTGSTYHYYVAVSSGGSASSTITTTASTPTTNMLIGALPAATATANYASKFEILITAYTDTTFFKPVQARGGRMTSTSTSSQAVSLQAGLWLSTAAITSIKVLLSSGNFVANSVLSLYGLP